MENNEDADKLATEGAKKGVAPVGEAHLCEHNSGKTHIFVKQGNQNSSRRWNNVHREVEEAGAEDDGDNRRHIKKATFKPTQCEQTNTGLMRVVMRGNEEEDKEEKGTERKSES